MTRTVEVNLLGTYHTVRAAGPLVAHPGGYVLLVASAAAGVQLPLMGAYAASKAAVEALGNTLRLETKHLGLRVGVAYLAEVDTDMTAIGFGTEAAAQIKGLGPFTRVAPRAVGVDAFERGIATRARRIYAPPLGGADDAPAHARAAGGRAAPANRGWPRPSMLPGPSTPDSPRHCRTDPGRPSDRTRREDRNHTAPRVAGTVQGTRAGELGRVAGTFPRLPHARRQAVQHPRPHRRAVPRLVALLGRPDAATRHQAVPVRDRTRGVAGRPPARIPLRMAAPRAARPACRRHPADPRPHPRRPTDPDWSPRFRAMLAATDQMVATKNVDDATWATLAEHLDDRRLVEFCLW